MTFELTLNNFYTLLCIAAVFIGALWTMVALIVRLINANLTKRFAELHQHMTNQDVAIEKQRNDLGKQRDELAELRLELAKDYVRRDDFNRVISTFQVTVDNLRLELRQWFLGGKQS